MLITYHTSVPLWIYPDEYEPSFPEPGSVYKVIEDIDVFDKTLKQSQRIFVLRGENGESKCLYNVQTKQWTVPVWVVPPKGIIQRDKAGNLWKEHQMCHQNFYQVFTCFRLHFNILAMIN